MTMPDALAALGVTPCTLAAEERRRLDEEGYLPLPGLLGAAELARLRARVEELARDEGPRGGSELWTSPRVKHPREEGVDRLADLANKGPAFDVCYTHPRVLAAMAHVLGPELKLSSLNGRSALPGHGAQKLHTDWPRAVPPGDYYVCNSIWLLDDFTAENGATRLVPGSHRSGRVPEEALADPWAPHPDEVLLVAPAGTVVIFNSHLWHGGTVNRSAAPRRALHSYFCRRDQLPQTDIGALVRPETLARLPAPARTILAL
jgi:ectoine hydroxylase-related dioxygenase (phytanoyl-CoA dioxygenase family)